MARKMDKNKNEIHKVNERRAEKEEEDDEKKNGMTKKKCESN